MSRLNAARTAFLALWHAHEAPTRTWRHSRHAKDRAPHGDLASLAGATVTLVGIADAFGTSDAATGSTTSPPRSPNSPQTSHPCRPA
jgi:hypothetical protein